MSSERIEWIDICKALAIFCMVFLHIGLELPCRCKGLDTVLHYWHMPIFIVLSGTVLNTAGYCGWSNFGKFLTSRVKSLLLPCLVFGFICLVFNSLFIFPNGVSASRGTLLQHILYPNAYLHMFELQWFLICLFLTELLYVLIHNVAGGRIWLIAFICVGLLASRLGFGVAARLPFTLDSVLYALPMFALGTLARPIFIGKRPLRRGWSQLAALILLLALCLSVKGRFNLRLCTFEPMWIYPFGILITVLVIFLIKEQEGRIKGWKCYGAVKWMGTNTLAILVMNGSVRKIIPWRNLVHSDSLLPAFFVQLLATLATLAIIYLVTKLIMRHCPWMLGKFTKNINQ